MNNSTAKMSLQVQHRFVPTRVWNRSNTHLITKEAAIQSHIGWIFHLCTIVPGRRRPEGKDRRRRSRTHPQLELGRIYDDGATLNEVENRTAFKLNTHFPEAPGRPGI